ncbi:hypothetical protein [Salana multivorans]
MALFRRSAPLPDTARSALGARKPLGWATDARGTTGVVVVDHLVLVDPDGKVREVPWQLFDGADWSDEQATLTLREVDGDTHVLRLPDDPRRFTQAVRERIEASLVHVVQRPAPGGGMVRAAIRRDSEGNLASQVSILGTARRDATITELAERVEAEARGAVGLSE